MFRIRVRSLLAIAVAAVMGVTLVVGGRWAVRQARQAPRTDSLEPPTAIQSQCPTVTALQGLEELATVRIRIADVLTASDGRYSGAWLIKGDALIAVDLSQARFDETAMNAGQKQAVLILPLPRVIQARLDHERTKTWDVKRVTWVPYSGNPDRLRDTAMLEGQKLVEFAAGQADCLDQGKLRTEALVAAIYGKLGWTVSVRWVSTTESTPLESDFSASRE